MLNELFEIAFRFEELAVTLAAMKVAHADQSETVARLERAEECAKHGAELARLQIERTAEAKPVPDKPE